MTDDNKISELYQQGREQGPSAHLDDTILNIAKDAVQADTGASKVKGPFSGGWPMTASIVAVLIITVVLVPLLQQEELSPTEKNIMNKPQSLMMEQDAVKQDAVKQKIYREMLNDERMEAKAKSKKRKLVVESRQKAERNMVVSPVLEADFSNVDNISSQEELPMLMSAPALSKESSPLMRSGVSAIMADDLSEAVLQPAEWLEKIKGLINKNELDQARDELMEFKKHYPDEKIDESIRDQL